MFGITQGPAKQTAADAISILSGRLQSATLLEDRRSAVLGLRSFSWQYPASVASGSLRGLIGSLTKDGDDVDTVKSVLETLLMLFNPNSDSPEASEEIALWLADEFTQRHENISILLGLLDTVDFHSRFYSLRLLTAIHRLRIERTEDCILTAPLGISRLVAILDETRPKIRNAGLELLTFLTPTNISLQKMVAYENAFDRLFAIIQAEGGLSEGGVSENDRIIEDCLILLSNLLRGNVSNQSFFRETNCVVKLGTLLNEDLDYTRSGDEIKSWAIEQRKRNLFALLAVIRLFLARGESSRQAKANQKAFSDIGVLKQVLQLAFRPWTDNLIRAEALVTCADLIWSNKPVQESFAQFQVPALPQNFFSGIDRETNSNGISNEGKVYVIDSLLSLVLEVSYPLAFDVRLAACGCLAAYIFDHQDIQQHFLRRAIDGVASGREETANVLTTLLHPLDRRTSNDQYRYWFASVIMFHLVFGDSDTKSLAMGVTEGDSERGEEVVTCIQMIASNLIDGIHNDDDERVSIGYLSLLCGWLFEDPDAVNDFLGEGGNIQSLVTTVLRGDRESPLVVGLSAFLLGIVYEFSTRDSPIPRATIYEILTSGLGREQYVNSLIQLRHNTFLRDYEVLPQRLSSAPLGGLPEVYFEKTFVDFFKDNFSRVLRAIDREAVMEVPVVTKGIPKGISRDMVDALRSQVDGQNSAMDKLKSALQHLEHQLEQERLDHRRAKDTASLELQKFHNENNDRLRKQEELIKNLREDHIRGVAALQHQVERAQSAAEAEVARLGKRHAATVAVSESTIARLNSEKKKANDIFVKDLQTANENFIARGQVESEKLRRAEIQLEAGERNLKTVQQQLKISEAHVVELKAQRNAAQEELEDLLVVFGDTEEKVAKYRDQLRNLGAEVSDGEANTDNEEEDEPDTKVNERTAGRTAEVE